MVNIGSDQIKQSILEILGENSNGLTINELSRKVKLYRATTAKYLLALQMQGLVSSKKLGPAKIYFSLESPDLLNVQPIMSPELEEDEQKDWIDTFISEIKEELKQEVLKKI